MISCAIKSYKRYSQRMPFLMICVFCVLMTSRTLTYSISHNNVHGDDLLDSSIDHLHLECYTESLVAVLFLLPHKNRCDLSIEYT